jgi:hypothetical protein
MPLVPPNRPLLLLRAPPLLNLNHPSNMLLLLCELPLLVWSISSTKQSLLFLKDYQRMIDLRRLSEDTLEILIVLSLRLNPQIRRVWFTLLEGAREEK